MVYLHPHTSPPPPHVLTWHLSWSPRKHGRCLAPTALTFTRLVGAETGDLALRATNLLLPLLSFCVYVRQRPPPPPSPFPQISSNPPQIEGISGICWEIDLQSKLLPRPIFLHVFWLFWLKSKLGNQCGLGWSVVVPYWCCSGWFMLIFVWEWVGLQLIIMKFDFVCVCVCAM